ncbi:MAG: peptidoglycan DD-metalloendopeptidase family protein [Ekhidna sp.]
MIDLIVYSIKVLAIHGLLYLFYWLFLKNTLRHHANRLFLLSSLCLAFVIPLIELPEAEKMPLISENELVITWLSTPVLDYEVVMNPIISKEPSATSYWFLLPLVYLGMTIFLIVRSIISLIMINRLKIHSVAIKKNWFKLFKTTHSRPFSFFSNVFIPESLFGSSDFDQILAHECVHVKQRHSVDRLLMDFAVSLFWFNPFIYLYRNALIEIHEYQADETVVNKFKDPIRYQEILFSQLQTPQYSGMVSHFNVSTIKKRIVMMNKQKKKSRWIYFIVAPLTLAMIFAFSSKSAMKPIELISAEMAGVIEPDDFKFPKINFYQADYQPSILPLRNSKKIRMTSGYGMRMHPIYQVRKMHMGIDFSCPIGTEVLAAADGLVEEVKVTSNGYGKRITIKHGNEYRTKYSQLSDFKVQKGDLVKKGQVIALSGNSGASTAPHLHYEIMDNAGKHIDPKPFIKDYKFMVSTVEKPSLENSGDADDLRAKNEELKKVAEREEIESGFLRSKDEKVKLNAEKLRKENEEKRKIEERENKKNSFQDEKQEPQLIKEEIFGSIEGSNKPLFVINGKVKRKGDVDNLVASNIELVKVLKDKKAFDKYGKAGENGVVEITIKEKKKSKQKKKAKNKQEAFKVIIDPGHGGKDSGEAYSNDLYEKDLVLAIAEKVKDQFSEQGEIEIVLTRDNDQFVSLNERKSSAENADLFISLHSQDYKDHFGGSVVLMYSNENYYYDRSKQIAIVLNDEFNDLNEGECSLASFSSDKEQEGGYWLMKNLEVPAVLVQFGLEKGEEFAMDESAIASLIARSIRIAAF